MNRSFYTLLFYLALPLIFFRLLWRSIKSPAYRLRWRERLGFYGPFKNKKKNNNIIFHAVSVGEVHAAVPLIRQVQKAFPERDIVLTTSTPTGSVRVKVIFGESVRHVYLPYDLPGAVKRFLGFTNADLLIILETELWPNLLHYCRRRGMKVMLVNARLSEKSRRNYQKIPKLVQKMLSDLNIVAAQSSADGEAFVSLGLPPAALQVTGSMKFDVSLDDEQVAAGKVLKDGLNSRPVLVAGSTREGEEEKVLDAFQKVLQLRPELLLILVPRHPERFDAVYALAQSRGFEIIRRTDEKNITPKVQVLLGDSMGEMQLYYESADIAFVGGSLVDTGCQNIIEPAALGLPVITGPSLYNFKGVSDILVKGGAMRVVQTPQELAQVVLELLKDKSSLEKMSLHARSVVKKNQGASERLMRLI